MFRSFFKGVRQATFAAGRFNHTLVITEIVDGKLVPASLSAAQASMNLGDQFSVLALSDSISKPTLDQITKLPKLNKVYAAQSPVFKGNLPEAVAPVVAALQKKHSFSHIVFAADAFGKSVMPRVAAALDVQALSDVIKVNSPNTFVRAIYAGNALQHVKSNNPVHVLSVRPTAFPLDAPSRSTAAPVEQLDVAQAKNDLSEWVSAEVRKSERPELTSARIVISGGRGMKNGENFKILYEFADLIGGAVGASRAAVDAGFVPNDLQVGQTGKIVAPELYIAVGISGAIQHLAGMKDSRVIACVNKDPEAPIFAVSDFGLVADLFDAVPKMTQQLRSKAKK